MSEPKKYRMLLIDPEKREITEMQIASGALSETIGCDGADTFRLADHGDQYDYGYVDDTGLARGEPIYAFQFIGREDPIGGKCLIYGCERYGGETCDAKFPLSTLNAVVRWLGLIKPTVTWTTNKHGQRASVTWEKVNE